MINYQVDNYARAKGLDPERITPSQRLTLKEEMIKEHYPGNNLRYTVTLVVECTLVYSAEFPSAQVERGKVWNDQKHS